MARRSKPNAIFGLWKLVSATFVVSLDGQQCRFGDSIACPYPACGALFHEEQGTYSFGFKKE